MQNIKLISLARGVYILGAVLSLIFLIPSTWFPFQLGKIALFSIGLSISMILFIVGGGLRDLFKSGHKSTFFVATLPLVYLASFYFSLDRSMGVSGFSVEADTILFITLGALVFFLASALFSNASSARTFLVWIFGAIAVAAVFQCFVILFGAGILPQAFADRSLNIVGKWYDLGLVISLLSLFVLLWAEFIDHSRKYRIISWIIAGLSVVLLSVIQSSLTWSILLIFFSLFLILLLVSARSSVDNSEKSSSQTMPWAPIAVVLVSALFLLFGSSLNTTVSKVFPVSSIEVRPSFSSTVNLIRVSHGDSFTRTLLGTGPQTFGEVWLINKDANINKTRFWNYDFIVGSSVFMTAIVTTGALGAFAWLIPLFLVLYGLMRAVRSAKYNANEKSIALCLSLCAMFSWATILFYVPSQNVILLAFALCGTAFGFSMGGAKIQETEKTSSLGKKITILISLILIGVSLWVTASIVRRFVAESYTNQGAHYLNIGNIDKALLYAMKARRIEETGNNLRLIVMADTVKLQQLGSRVTPTKEETEQFVALVLKVQEESLRGIALHKYDYRTYLVAGRAEHLLASAKIPNTYELAKQAYMSVVLLNPTSPEIALLLAQLEVANGNEKMGQTYLAQALTLKPDYTDAILFAVQMYIASNDAPNAIAAARAAVKSAPGMPAIWFELGLLYYSTSDTANALLVFEQALRIEPSYANAKYFLGLSYVAQKRTQDAVVLFKDLTKTHPDNLEVAFILSNLEAGNPPFYKARAPVTPTPQTRAKAPISQ